MNIINRRSVLTGLAAAAVAPIIPSSPAIELTQGHWVDYGSIDRTELGPLFFHGMPVHFDDECPPATVYMFNADMPEMCRAVIMAPDTAEILFADRDAGLVRLKLK